MEDTFTQMFREAFGWKVGFSDYRKAIYRLKILENGCSTQQGFACALQIQNKQRYFLMTSSDILPNEDLSKGTKIIGIADRYCNKWSKHESKHQILLENLTEVLHIQNSICFIPLKLKPQHYLRHNTSLSLHQGRLEAKPNLVMNAFRDEKFVQLQFTFIHQEARYTLADRENSPKNKKEFIGSPLFIQNEGSDLVVGIVGGQSKDDEEIRPVLFATCQSVSPVENQKVVTTKSQIPKNLNKNNFDGHIDCLVRRYHPGTREKILDKIQRMVKNQNAASDSHIMVILAHAGIGKSVLAATACKIMERKGKLGACHFLQQSNSLRNSPRMMFESLASHLCETVVGFQKKLEQRLLRIDGQDLEKLNCREMFNVFLEDPLNSCSPPQNGNYLVVIDALDECDPSQKKELTTALFNMSGGLSALPKWIKILITSRPTREDLPPMPGLTIVHINPNDPENVSDVRKYLQDGLEHIYLNAERTHLTLCVNQLADEADAFFLFAFFVLDIARTKRIELSKVPKIFPKGISSVYEEYFSRLQNELNVDEEKFFDFLEAIVAAQEPLPEAMLLQILGFDDRSRRARKLAQIALNSISILLPVLDGHVTVFHKSVVDWLLGKREVGDQTLLAVKGTEKFHDHCFRVRTEDGHTLLAKYSMDLQNSVKASPVFPPPLNDSERYALKFGLRHMMSAGNFEEYLKSCLEDLELLTASFLTMPLKMFLKVVDNIELETSPEEDVSFWPLTRWSLINTHLENLCYELSALNNFGFNKVPETLPIPIQSTINCPVSSVVRDKARLLARTPKYKDFVFLEWKPDLWDLPETIISDVSMNVSPTGKTAIVWGTNRPRNPFKITIAAVHTSEKIASDVFIFHDSCIPPRDVCVSPDEKNVMFVTAFGCLEHRNIDSLLLERKFETKQRQCATSCCFSKSGDEVVAGYGDGNICVWDFNKASVERIFYGEAGEIICCVVSEDRKLLTGAINNDNNAGTLVVWKSLTDPSSVVLSRRWVPKYKCVAFSPSGDRIIAVCLKDVDEEIMSERLLDLLTDVSFIQLFDANNGNLLYSACQLFDNVLGLLAINETTMLLSIKTEASNCCLALLDAERDEVVSRAVVGREVYSFIRHGNTSKITVLCVEEYSPSLFRSSCGFLFLDLNLLNFDYKEQNTPLL